MTNLKQFSLFLLVLFSLYKSVGQDMTIDNILWGQKESKMVYIGVINKFVVSSDIDSISADPKHVSVFFLKDTLLIRPHSEGAIHVSIWKKGAASQFTFNAAFLPPLDVGFDFAMNKESFKRENLPDAVEVVINSSLDRDFARQFSVINYQLQIGNNTFKIKGNKLTSEIRAEIKNSKPGNKIVIGRFEAQKNGNPNVLFNVQSRAEYLIL